MSASAAVHRLRVLKARIVASAAWVLYATGILHLLVYLRTRNRAIVLMYHRVVAPDELDATFSHPGIIVDAVTFEKHLRLLRRHFRVLPIDEFARRMHSGEPFPGRTCLITFDDGWIDNYTRAFPLLRKHDLPAVIFLPAGYIGTGRRFWQETLTYALLRALDDRSAPASRRFLEQAGVREPYPANDVEAKAALCERVGELKSVPAAVRQSLLDQADAIVAGNFDAVDRIDAFLTWDQVREMAAGRISFGSHTLTHELLTRVSRERVQEEVAGSKRAIEQALGKPIVAFSYPNGEYDAQTCRVVAESGYEVAFTTQPGNVGAQDDPFRIRRINIHRGTSSSIPLLMARMAGVL